MLRFTEPTLAGLAILLTGTLPLLIGHRLRRRWLGRLAVAAGALVAVAGLAVTGWGVAMATGDRTSRAVDIAPGITYERVAVDEPRRQVYHIAVVDLEGPCLELTTSVPAPDGEVAAETTTDFAARTGALLAVNAGFFHPVQEYPPWSAYPRSGDPVTAIGQVIAGGRAYGFPAGEPFGRALAVVDRRVTAGPAPDAAELSVPARLQLVADREVVAPPSDPWARTVAGVDIDRNRLVLVVADGRQPGYAEGSTYLELAQLLVDRGVDEAVEFDGGGSSTLAATVDDRVELLNRPSHQRIPGRQRPVATNLGVVTNPDCF